MERKTEDIPSLDSYAGLALAAGQSGMGVGGGGGVIGGGGGGGNNQWAQQQLAQQQEWMRGQIKAGAEREKELQVQARKDRIKANEDRRAERTAAKKELNERLAAERKVAEENRKKLEDVWDKANEERMAQQEKFDKKHSAQVEKYEQAMAEGRERDAANHMETISKLESNWNQTNSAFANAMQGLVDAQANTPAGQPIDLDITVNGQLVDSKTGTQPIDPNNPTGGTSTEGPPGGGTVGNEGNPNVEPGSPRKVPPTGGGTNTGGGMGGGTNTGGPT